MENILLKINKFLFSWYYKRVPDHFRKWTFIKSVKILIQNYEHSEFRNKGLNEVLCNASKREREMTTKISSLELKLRGVSQKDLDSINKIFGTNLKGKSNEEQNN